MTRRPVRELRYVPGRGAVWPDELIPETVEAQVEAQVEALAEKRAEVQPLTHNTDQAPRADTDADAGDPPDEGDQTTKRRRRGDDSQEG